MNYDHWFGDDNVRMDVLRQRAFNMRWAQQDEDVLVLTAADSDFPIAAEIQQAIQDYVGAGVLSYGPAEGLPAFRQAVADALDTRRGIRCTPDCVLAADSAASAMFVVAKFALRPGDEAIIFDPVDFLFRASTEAAGGRPVLCPVDKRSGAIDVDAVRRAITPRTRLLGLCSPNNPLGTLIPASDLRALGELAVERGLWIMNDEIWSDITYAPNRYVSIASLSPEIAARTITVSGFSKNYGLSGLRIGYLAAPSAEVFEALIEASHARTTAWGAATLSQIAAQAAYTHGAPFLEAFLRHLTRVRDYAVDRLNAMPGVACRKPEATYLLFPDISAHGLDSMAMADYLLKQARVAVVPGAARWFGPGAEGHIRLAFPTSMRIVAEALDRIDAALRRRG